MSFLACFDADGRCLVVGSSGTWPGAVHTVPVPMGTNPNAIYFDVPSGEIIYKPVQPITVSRNLITGIPVGTEVRVAGRMPLVVDGGTFAFVDEEEGNRWVRLTHPLYLDWAGNVAVGPSPE